jgi:aromatase
MPSHLITGSVCTAHTAFVAAPPWAVYQLIADTARWPHLFPSIVHVERLGGGPGDERLRLWAAGNGVARSWVSHRELDGPGLRIRFRHEAPQPPVAALTGEWVFVPLPSGGTSVVLLHEFGAVGADPASTALIKQTVDRSSTAELALVKSTAELGDRLNQLVRSATDSMLVRAPVRAVYDVLHRAEDWPRLCPQVVRTVVDESQPGVQTLEMATADGTGPVRTTNLVRVCFPPEGIAFKDARPPAPALAHVGRWVLQAAVGGTRVTARTTVKLDPGRAGSYEDGELVLESLRRTSAGIVRRAAAAAEHRAEQLG